MSKTFHDNFKRITAGQNIAEITKATGLDQGSVSRYLNGSRVPRLPRLRRIARAYNVSVDELDEPLEGAA
ncbi:helix-turn-helix transcriptional regulator [Kitasatospora sp. NBC_01287]|uniref:helix-turn-helix domain-containing protein n=1 Tax=Kitasatospora sp. NBC_01287 TaxID=2903573 RepID=UPI0022587C2D|nr:helix-turn-helix transcriptional regulator [Kitasatospora sp. NBC_01287]MCX4751709.1 helix-turn-helix transcriptional regulator [Kitasatospora sp. NBC_01287]MCX4751999.1 helix-turn-helix transcriptional regulator [Kitasatospora sp. NBC_01287]